MYIALAAIFVAMGPLSQLERACRVDVNSSRELRPCLRTQVAFRCIAEVVVS
jgi:hypothetical protein